MSPLHGIVINRGVELVIRLSTGAKLRVSRQKDLRLGDTVFVLYDYTQMVIRDIWTEDEYFALEDDGDGEAFFPLPPRYEEPNAWADEPEICPVVSL